MAITDEDVAVEIRVLDGASDPDGDALTVTLAKAPGHNVEIVSGAIVKVTPQRNFHGRVSVAYTVSDGIRLTNGQVILTVLPVNDPPIASGHTLNAHGKTPVMLEGSDVDGDALSYEVVAAPAHGTVTGTASMLEYTPMTGFVGDDAITYRVIDGAAASEPATIQLHVLPGSAPTALAGAASGTEDTPLAVTLVASDPDADPLTFTIEAPPLHGTLSGTAPNLVYTPAQDFNGSDSLQFSVADGYGSSNIATVTISVAAVNDPPVATPQTIAATEDTARSITLAGSDVEGATLTFVVQSPPLHGTLSGFGATLTYTPQVNYHGPDSFAFRASDSATSSVPATVTIDVASVEDVPVAQAVFRTLSEDNSSAVTLVGSDADRDPIAFAVTTPPAHGTLSGTAPALIYRPAANYNGPDSFAYTVSDGDDTSAPASVTLQVTSVNDDPVATNSSIVTAEDTPVTIPLQATDVDNATLTFSIVILPADGFLSGTGPNLTYTPAPNATGSRSFTFRARDGVGGFADATVSIQITPVNDPPTTADDFVFTEPGSPKTFGVIANDIDIEGDSVQLDSVDAPAHGSVEMVDGELVYTPEASFTGVEIFTYTAIDSHGATSTGNVHVGVGTFPPGAPTQAIATIAGSITSSDLHRAPSISSDGRYIAFTSSLPLVNDDTNGVEDVYLYDRGTGAITRISVATGGGQGNAGSVRPHLSDNGRYAVFESLASNLVAGDTNGVFDVFRHDRVTGETIRISVATGGEQASRNSFDAEISEDGNLVVFQSIAFELIDSDANGALDIFVRDVAAGTTTRVSVTATGREADLSSTEPAISGDGRYVAFTSSATNLVAGDTNNVSDVFVRDLFAGTTTRVSVSSIGGESNSACSRASLSRDGRFISFQSAATNLVGGTPPPAQVIQLYVRDAQQQTTTRSGLSSTSSANIIWARLSADGRYVTVFNSFGVVIRDRFTGFSSTPSGASSWLWPMISANGRYVVALDTSNGGRVIVTPNPL